MVNKSKLNTFISRIVPWRVWVQSAFLLVWLDPAGLRLHNICGPVFHCYACPLATFACPIGVIAQFGAVQLFPFIAVGLLLTLGALFGSVICGWVCPFGLLQDLTAKVPVKKFKLPKWSGHFRYVVLIVAVLAVPYFFGEGHWLFICRVCPAGALEAAVPNMVSQAATGKTIVWPNGVKLTILVVFLIAIFISIRPWCRVLCPLGAIFSFFNRFSIFSMRLDEYKCTKCNRCRTLCSYGIEPDITPNTDRCIRCLECTKCGPGALRAGTIFEGGVVDDDKKIRRKAITLIELLVVISIIALLLAILLPSLKKAKSQGRAIICKSNLHQWGLVWKMYANDHNGYLSDGVTMDGGGWYRGQWIHALRSYWSEREKMLFCPSSVKPKPDNSVGEGGPYYSYEHGGTDEYGRVELSSYGVNNWVYNPPADVSDIQGRPAEWHWRRLDAKGGSEIPIFLDSMWRGGGPYYEDPIAISPPDYNGQWRSYDHEISHFCIDRHSHTVNSTMMDLSVEKIPLKKLWQLKWHRKFDTVGWQSAWPAWMEPMKEY